MANTSQPHGFRAISGPYRAREYTKSSSSTAIGVGDLVFLQTDGTIARCAAGPSQVCGVALTPSPASTADTVLVSDHPDTVYEAQTDGSSGGGGVIINAVTALFCNADVVDGTPVNGHSIQQINESTGATTATLPLKILRLYKAVNNAYGANNRMECILNTSIYKSVGTLGLA